MVFFSFNDVSQSIYYVLSLLVFMKGGDCLHASLDRPDE